MLQIQALKADGMAKTVSWQLQAGELWSLYGASGSGKSQLLKSLADLVPNQGEVHLQGRARSAMSAPEWRRQVMYFAAETAWWLETVSEHFVSPPKEEVLQSIGLSPSLLSQHPDQLSSGEKQRLALLRGLAFEPSVLLLDEISANLDPESTVQVEALIQSYLVEGERCAIWISHDRAQRERLACPAFCLEMAQLYQGESDEH